MKLLGIERIVFKKNNTSLIIEVGDVNRVLYDNFSINVDKDKVFYYLRGLFNVVTDWEEKYIDTRIIDGDTWELAIIYSNGNKRKYCGRAKFPINFETLERLNHDLVRDVYYG